MHTTLVDMFLLFVYHFLALEGRFWTVVNTSSVRGVVLYYSGGGVCFCCGGGVRFFLNENIQECYSYVAARGRWRTGADHELESCPIGLMHCGHFFCSVRPLFLSDKASTHNVVQRPPTLSFDHPCLCTVPASRACIRPGAGACSCRPAVQPLSLKQLN